MAGGSSKFYFNGGTLKPTVSDADVATALAGMASSTDRLHAIPDPGCRGAERGDHRHENQSISIDQNLLPGTGTGGLTKQGLGTLTLLGTTTYTGDTTVSGGTLLVNGTNSGTGAVNVSANASLGGTGSIGSNTMIAVDGRLAFTLSTLAASHDPLNITGTLAFSGASVLNIAASGSLPAPGLYTLVTTTGGITGSAPVLNLPPGWEATVSISGGNDLVLDVTVIGAGASPAGPASTHPAKLRVRTTTMTAWKTASNTSWARRVRRSRPCPAWTGPTRSPGRRIRPTSAPGRSRPRPTSAPGRT